jgi:MFS family permease
VSREPARQRRGSGVSVEHAQGQRLLLPVLTVVFLAALDLTVVAPILPEVINDLQISAIDADRYSWIVLSYLVAYTVTVPLTGRISDFVGRMPVFTAAMLLFLAGSVVVATSEGLGPMIAGRTLQGLGGGAMLPVSMALVADVVPPHRRASTLGLVAAVDTFGWVLGPLWGAGVQSLFDSWRAIFWLNLPLGGAAAVTLFFSRARAERAQSLGRPGVLPALLGTAGLVTFSLALSSGGEGGLSASQGAGTLGGATNPLADYRWPIFGLSVILFGLFVLLERRAANPILPRTLVRERIFQVAGVANLLVGAALIIAMVNAPLAVALLADEDDVSVDTALLLGSFTLAMTAGAIAGGRLVDRIGVRVAAALGLGVATAGFASMWWWPDRLELGLMAATMIVAGLGLGVVVAPIGEAAIRAARVHDYGAASGLVLLARLVGMTVGLSGITAYGLDRIDRRIADLPPISPNPGESTSQYFERQQDFLNAQLIPLTLDVIRETFVIAAVVCIVAALVVSRLRARADRPS